MNRDDIHTCHSECQRPICVAVREAVAAEREKFCSDLRALHDVYSLQSVSTIRERGAP
jgi:hypothetical protein